MGPKPAEPTRLIAFLRAINVGGHNVKMAKLRSLFEGLGFSRVETFIASGNVIFQSTGRDAQQDERNIERHLQASLGYEVATFIRTGQELTEIADYKPFAREDPAGEGNSLYVAFLAAPPGEQAQAKLMALSTPVDDFHVRGREVYWLRRTKVGESAFSGAILEKTLRVAATVRNSTTVRKLAEKYGSP